MDENNEFSNPLEGIKVLELSHIQAGPICSMMLADMGADVIKVEPFAGDRFRQLFGGANFLNFNRNKRAMAVNLKTPKGRKICLELAKNADVLVENYLPGALHNLGLGYEHIKEINPKIIYCSISGYGQEGPFRLRPAFDPILQAISGVMESTGEPDRSPVRIRPALIDYCTGAIAAFAIASALLRRGKTDCGERIDMALLDVALYSMSPYITHYKKWGELMPRTGSAHPAACPNQNFETKDGFVCIAASSDPMWRSLCNALGIEEVGNNPRYLTQQLRAKHRSEIADIISRETKKYSSKELEKKLLEAHIACAMVRNISEIIEEPHVQARGILEEFEHPVEGTIMTSMTPIVLSNNTSPMRRYVPTLGADTREIMQEMGYGEQEIRDLIDQKIVMQYEG